MPPLLLNAICLAQTDTTMLLLLFGRWARARSRPSCSSDTATSSRCPRGSSGGTSSGPWTTGGGVWAGWGWYMSPRASFGSETGLHHRLKSLTHPVPFVRVALGGRWVYNWDVYALVALLLGLGVVLLKSLLSCLGGRKAKLA